MANYRENIQKAYEIRKGVTKFIREAVEEIRTEKSKIENNINLSYEGKKEATKKLQDKYEKGFLTIMKQKEDEVNALIDEAKVNAENVLTATLPPVSNTQQKLFDMTLKNVEGKVTFALGTNQAFAALDELMQAVNEPLLAQQALDKFLPLSMTALSLAADTERPAVKQRLGKIYEQLDARAQVEGAGEAREALQTINAMKGAGYVTGYVQDAVKEISMDSYNYVNRPNEYFAAKGE
ncbi:hypothetical protein [Neobacillus citreus]|uniref:Uncharacterized protein n=1 Tax=Neobacillus citreus TaxID=2833578 RepID=A0A942Y6U4_9BACI|nr:hypothetical protein [Neobacillus citreus]MCH6264619.1 hypothetical protein [Neobacillus citreus]